MDEIIERRLGYLCISLKQLIDSRGLGIPFEITNDLAVIIPVINQVIDKLQVPINKLNENDKIDVVFTGYQTLLNNLPTTTDCQFKITCKDGKHHECYITRCICQFDVPSYALGCPIRHNYNKVEVK